MEKHIRNQYIGILKTKIAENVQKSINLRIDARFESGLKRHQLHLDQGYIGYDTRRYLLAYGMLRFKKYKECEQKTKTEVSAWSIMSSVKKLGIELDTDQITNWLAGVESERAVA